MSEKFERCEMWAVFISVGPPLLRAEPMRVADFTSSSSSDQKLYMGSLSSPPAQM